jgi:hypothetical protein
LRAPIGAQCNCFHDLKSNSDAVLQR